MEKYLIYVHSLIYPRRSWIEYLSEVLSPKTRVARMNVDEDGSSLTCKGLEFSTASVCTTANMFRAWPRCVDRELFKSARHDSSAW